MYMAPKINLLVLVCWQCRDFAASRVQPQGANLQVRGMFISLQCGEAVKGEVSLIV